jgi:hypothetical protein
MGEAMPITAVSSKTLAHLSRRLAPMDLEDHTLDPVIERTCAECGARLTDREIRASLEAGTRYLCAVHAAEEVPLEEEDELEADA